MEEVKLNDNLAINNEVKDDQNSITKDILDFISGFFWSIIVSFLLSILIYLCFNLLFKSEFISGIMMLVTQAIMLALYIVLIFHYLKKKREFVSIGIGIVAVYQAFSFAVGIIGLIGVMIAERFKG